MGSFVGTGVALGADAEPAVNEKFADLAPAIADEAQRPTKEFLAIEKAKIAIKESYVAKMSKVLSARTVARFF